MKNSRTLLLITIASVSSLGCMNTRTVAHARGAHDLGCSQEEATIEDIPGVPGTYTVHCKDQKATYVCASTRSGIICDRDA